MNNSYLTGLRTVFLAVFAASLVFVPWTNSTAQTSIDEFRNAGGLVAEDGTVTVNTGDDDARPEKRQYTRSNYVWQYASGPNYASVSDLREPGVVTTPAGAFNVSDLPLAPELRVTDQLAELGEQHFIISFNYDVAKAEDFYSVIEANDGKVTLASDAGMIVAKLTPQARQAIGSALGLVAITPYHGGFKLDPTIGRTPLADPVKALSETYSVEVGLWHPEDASSAAAKIAEIGGTVTGDLGSTWLIVDIHRSLLHELAAIDAVRSVHESLPYYPTGEETTTTMQTGNYNGGSIPYHTGGVTGAGLNRCENNVNTACTVATEVADCGGGNKCLGPQVLMVLDSGFQLDAGDLSDTRSDGAELTPVGLTHRKVREHLDTNNFGGSGDLRGCDAPPQGGFTHGHVVSAGALGKATAVDTDTYGTGWIAFDTQGNGWNLDGVAPDAVLVAYDGQITPPNGSCSDPLNDTISPGKLYDFSAPTNGICNGVNLANCPGSLAKAYEEWRASVINFSWGSDANTYSALAQQIDQFMDNKHVAAIAGGGPSPLVIVAAGNNAQDNIPAGGDGFADPFSIGSPATARNSLAIGASRNADTTNQPESRAFFSSTGPTTGTSNRIGPQLMAPGDELAGGNLGISSEYTCRTNDNDQLNPVECDIINGAEGTSFAAPAASGAALLVYDYFGQGYHPDQVRNEVDHLEVGSALVKAVLIASADYMNGANLQFAHRWNYEQGYGRIQLDQALPISSSANSPTGMLIHDPVANVSDIGLSFTVSTNQVNSQVFEVVNDDEELRIALTWIDRYDTGSDLDQDIDLKLISPSGIEYRGNYFTDNAARDGTIDPNEDCGGIGAADANTANSLVDEGQWSQPICDRTKIRGRSLSDRPFDDANPTEGIFLSPDPLGDDQDDGTDLSQGLCTANSLVNPNGPCDNNLDCRIEPNAGGADIGVCVHYQDYKQTEIGDWTIFVQAGATPLAGQRNYSLAIVGGVSLGSAVRFDRPPYTCNQAATITVTEVLDVGSEGTDDPTDADVEDRITVEVIDQNPLSPTYQDVVDTEVGGTLADEINFTQDPNSLKFTSDPVQLTDGTARTAGNGVLDVRDGDRLQVLYTDADTDAVGLPLTVERTNNSVVSCVVDIGIGSIVFGQFGQDSSVFVNGGCERNVRGEFYFGFPDRYMDADEDIIFSFAFDSNEGEDLESVVAGLSCVKIDADSPAGCLPTGAGCVAAECGGTCDPRRENNPPCDEMTILDSPKGIGFLPAGQLNSVNFSIEMAGDGPGEPFEAPGIGQPQPTPTVELVLALQASVSGKTQSGLGVSRQRLNVDPESTFYSTDYPNGGTEVLDYGPGLVGNNDEIASNPITELANFQSNDYRFETWVFSSITANPANDNLNNPWNFDRNNGGFTIGLASPTDETQADQFNIYNWGEDKNFNGIQDGVCASNLAIACYNIGGLDARCGNTICNSTENNDLQPSTFVFNWNTKGGCGWQTREVGECELDPTRGCFENDDCAGTCQVANNQIVSTFDPCQGDGDCPLTQSCNQNSPINRLGPCVDNTDCGGGFFGICEDTVQLCSNAAGDCQGVVGDHTGGVWHTGVINNKTGPACDGTVTGACMNYKTIGGTGDLLVWWELLVTPVMSKIDQSIGADGLPTSTIEFVDWGWNGQLDLRDEHATYTWELDTDLATLDPVDLFSDFAILGAGTGSFGALNEGNNPNLTEGWPIFAPQCSCTTAPMGTCRNLFECSPGACTSSQVTCFVDADCDPGSCSSTAESCFSVGDCPPVGLCDITLEPCNVLADCPDGGGDTACIGGQTCDSVEGCAGAPTCDCSGNQSVNGSLGGNREGEAGCLFEGGLLPSALEELGTARPRDDDIDNDQDGRENPLGACSGNDDPCNSDDDCAGTCQGRCSNDSSSCLITAECGAGTCIPLSSGYDCADSIDNDGDGATDLADATCETWTDLAGEGHGIDEFIAEAGPYRNMSVVDWNGPDMRFNTMEDIYGDTGNTFQAAVGFANFEGDTTGQAQQSYGLAVDDMVVKWREFTLDEDLTDCAVNFSCASVDLSTGRVYEGQTVLTITVLESTPPPENDCDQDTVPDGTVDCDNDGIRDLAVKANSEVDVAGEAVILNCTEGGTPTTCGGSEYRGTVPISSLSDAPGVVFVAIQGADNPTVLVTYKDDDIDPGPGVEVCPNDVDTNAHGFITNTTVVFLGAACEVTVVGTETTDNGDHDLFIDTKERANMKVCVINNCGEELNNCTGRLFSNSPTVDCILDSTIDVGTLLDDPNSVCIDDEFVWQMTGASRTDPNEDFGADFNFTMTCDQIDGLSVAQEFGLQLDLDLFDGNQTSVSWSENFETGTLNQFFAENLDDGIPGNNNTEGLANGDGWRCQYSDPDWVNANSYGDEAALDCYPGASLDGANAIYWQVDGTTTGSPDGGRAFTGDYSAYYGIYLTEPAGEFTSPLASVESIAMANIVNLGVGDPVLTLWQQVSIMDGRGLGGIDPGFSADRGVVQVKLKDNNGDDITEWMVLEPFINTYANQAVSNYFNCMFDPVDDGNTEDDFFDPTDPARDMGPSSTCFPELTYACQGDTDGDFDPSNICQATEAPALDSHDLAFGTGTWVQASFDLSTLRGRRVQLRFLVTALKADFENWEGQFDLNPAPQDDGWWIDDLEIDDTLALPAEILVDSNVLKSCDDNPDQGCLVDQDCLDAGDAGPCTGLPPECGDTCSIAGLTVSVVTVPDANGGPLAEELSAPGQPIEIDASASSGTCIDGTLQIRFDKGGSIARDFSENPVLTDAPALGAVYDVFVRCSTDTACQKSTSVAVTVDCPGDVVTSPEFDTIIAQNKTEWSWSTYVEYFQVRGLLSTVSSYGVVSKSEASGTSFIDASVPAVGEGLYYVVREARYCNQQSKWTSGGVNEDPARETSLP